MIRRFLQKENYNGNKFLNLIIEEHLEKILAVININELQKIALLGTAGILRMKYLDFSKQKQT